MNTTLFFISKPEQVPYVRELLNGRDAPIVVALDYEIELDLQKHGIPFVSLVTIAVSPDGDRALLERTRALASGWYTASETAFFEYDGIKLGEQYEPAILYYIQTVFYWAAMLDQVFTAYPNAISACVFEKSGMLPTADPVAVFRARVVEDVVRLLAKKHNVTVEVIRTPLVQQSAVFLSVLRIALEQWFARAISVVWNALVDAWHRPRPIVLFATDPWYRVEPFISTMPDVELIMSRRQEMRTMLPVLAWRARARFNHRLDFVDAHVRELARTHARTMAERWDALGETPEISRGFVYNNISLWPVVRQALDCIVKEYAEDTIATIENTKRLFARYKVNCVLLRTSIKGYSNLVARVAENMDIPSIELEHALINNEKTLVHCRLNSRYLASYGPLINRIYESWGIASQRLVSVGSPRFDRYASALPKKKITDLQQRLGLKKWSCTVMWGMPEVSYSLLEYGNHTSYEVQRIFEDVADAQRDLSLQTLFRPRPSFRKSFYEQEIHRLFGKESRLLIHEDLQILLALSDIVLSGTSTVILEALLMHKAVIMYVPKVLDNDFKEFWESGAVLMARTKEELHAHLKHLVDPNNRAALVARADVFVQGNFVLDGKSSERVAALIRRVSNVKS